MKSPEDKPYGFIILTAQIKCGRAIAGNFVLLDLLLPQSDVSSRTSGAPVRVDGSTSSPLNNTRPTCR